MFILLLFNLIVTTFNTILTNSCLPFLKPPPNYYVLNSCLPFSRFFRNGPLTLLHILLLLFLASRPNLTCGNFLHVVTRANFAPAVTSIVCSQSLLGLSLLPGLPPNGPLALLLIIPLYFPLHSSLWLRIYSALSLAPWSVFFLGRPWPSKFQ